MCHSEPKKLGSGKRGKNGKNLEKPIKIRKSIKYFFLFLWDAFFMDSMRPGKAFGVKYPENVVKAKISGS